MSKALYTVSGLATLDSKKNATLNEALYFLTINAKYDKDEITDCTGVRDGAREVAFWCDWNNCIRAAAGAKESERKTIALING